MGILSEVQLNQCKEEARKQSIRQDVKSHCTKIRQGILKNGSTSGNRAIWELFQNAGDLVEDACAEICITLKEDAFVFAHKGKPFTYDTLCSLVKQVSSEEKENPDAVGQYGTGFLTTHKFSRTIIINGSMKINDDPEVYTDINDFVINRENFNNIPRFIEDMTEQIMAVEQLLDAEQKNEAKEWTSLSYLLNDERKVVAQTAIDEAIKTMPYVLTFNDKIGSCLIEDQTRDRVFNFTKLDHHCSVEGLKCKQIVLVEDGRTRDIFCYYLELHGGESRVILPLNSETQVCYLEDIPRLFVHFPLIGPSYFGVNFLFHSHRFTPEEPRDNIIVPKDNDATDETAAANKQVLDEMTGVLWDFLEKHVEFWLDTLKMASVNIKDRGYTEAKTGFFYSQLKRDWVTEFEKLKIIESREGRYCMNDVHHPVVLEPSLEEFVSSEEGVDRLSVIYPYVQGAAVVPAEHELIQWSRIIADWNPDKTENFLTWDMLVQYVSHHQGDRLHAMLQMIVDAGKSDAFFDKYALIPNREGMLRKRNELRDAQPVVKDLYALVRNLNTSICDKMVDEAYADIVSLTSYSRTDLREELNATVKAKEDECWKNVTCPTCYEGEFEKNLIALCSSFTTVGGDSKRNRLMPVIAKFEGMAYEELHIPAWEGDAANFDLYRQIFVSLVENQMKKIEKRDAEWVKQYMDDLIVFVDNARGDDYKNFCTQYAIYPDMRGELHKPGELKKKDRVNEKLFFLYEEVFGEDLRHKCVDERFEGFYGNYAQDECRYTAQSVAKEIHNKLSGDQYQHLILLDIIELTEEQTVAGSEWRLLFKDIYDRRESIRYNLGTDTERKAINTLLKRKNPGLMVRMADISEREDAVCVLDALNATLDHIEHETYIKRLGSYAEECIHRFLLDVLPAWGVSVVSQQGGQDFILSKEGYEDYYVEVKSRWENDQSIEMSAAQFARAVDHPERYALVGMNMYHFDRHRVEVNEEATLAELLPCMKVLDTIGFLEADLRKRTDEAFRGGEREIRLNGSYTVRVPQDVFDAHSLGFDAFTAKLKGYFGSVDF